MLNVAMIAPSVDPISVAVIANRLTAITKEMGQIMLLTSRSPIFSESRDFVTAIFDAQGQLVAQTSYIPVLLGAIPFAMKAICRKYQNQDCYKRCLSHCILLRLSTCTLEPTPSTLKLNPRTTLPVYFVTMICSV